MSLRHFPLFVHNGESDVFIWNPSAEADRQGVNSAVLLQIELRSSSLICQLWVKDVKFVTLDNFWGRVLRVVMRLIVFVPLISLLYAVEEARLSHYKKLLF